MKTAELKKYFDKTNQKVIKYLLKSDNKHPVKTLHELRVEIKKIRFISHLIQHFDKQSDAGKLYKPYEKVFKKAGKIRTLQMQNKLIYQFELTELFDDIIKENNKTGKKLLKKFFKESEIQSEVLNAYKPMILASIDKTIHPDIESYSNHLVRFLYDNLSDKTKPENLHELRKDVKELIFIGKFSKELRTFISKRIKLKLADNLQDKIGGWHDKGDLQKSMTEELVRIKKPERIKYQMAISKIKAAMNKDLKEIKLLVADFHQNINLITLK
jgi:CHAD domain-containing protein